jgi:hypothetical protein
MKWLVETLALVEGVPQYTTLKGLIRATKGKGIETWMFVLAIMADIQDYSGGMQVSPEDIEAEMNRGTKRKTSLAEIEQALGALEDKGYAQQVASGSGDRMGRYGVEVDNAPDLYSLTKKGETAARSFLKDSTASFGEQKVNPHAKGYTLDSFTKAFFGSEAEDVLPAMAREFWKEFQGFDGNLQAFKNDMEDELHSALKDGGEVWEAIGANGEPSEEEERELMSLIRQLYATYDRVKDTWTTAEVDRYEFADDSEELVLALEKLGDAWRKVNGYAPRTGPTVGAMLAKAQDVFHAMGVSQSPRKVEAAMAELKAAVAAYPWKYKTVVRKPLKEAAGKPNTGIPVTLKKDSLKLKDGTVLQAGEKATVRFDEANPAMAIVDFASRPNTRISTKYLEGIFGKPFMKMPTWSAIEKMGDGIAKSVTGKKVEPEGFGPDGSPSWLLVLGLV